MKTALKFFVLGALTVIAILSCMVVPVFSVCNTDISAPETSLIEIHGGCSTDTKSRHPDCVSAVHRYCTMVDYATPRTVMGTTRDHNSEVIGLSCIDTIAYDHDVSISELQGYHSECRIHESQWRHCLSAIHRYCRDKYGENAAGMSQEVNANANVLDIGCFRSTHKEEVSVENFLTVEHPDCKLPESQSDRCFSAASAWCRRYHRSTGGITQETDADGGKMTVACYNASYYGDAYIRRNDEFISARNEAVEVCEVNFDIPAGASLSNPEVLYSEMYNNGGSDAESTSVFEFSISESSTSRFEFSSSITISATATFMVGIPTIAEGSIELSTSLTVGFSMSEEVTKTTMFSHSSTVHIPPFRNILKEAAITRSNLVVPWSALVRNKLGKIVYIDGMWHGVETYGLVVTQKCV